MSAEWFAAICAGVTLLILWTSTVIGGAVWLMRQFTNLKTSILGDLDAKHRENDVRLNALQKLVEVHDVILKRQRR